MTFPDPSTLRVEIQQPATGLENLVDNPSGALGAWGWVSLNKYSKLTRYTGYGFPTLRSVAGKAGDDPYASEPLPLMGGQWHSARVNVHDLRSTGQPHLFYLSYYDNTGILLALSPTLAMASSITGNVAGVVYTIAPRQAPAGTASVRMWLSLDGQSAGGTLYDTGITFSRACLSTGTSAAQLADLPFLEPTPYTSLTPWVSQLKITRSPLSASTYTCAVLNPDLDPLTNPLIRGGRRTRITALTPAGTWEPLFTGRVSPFEVTYRPLHRKPDKRTLIEFSAVDGLADLTQNRPIGPTYSFDLPLVLEGAGIPWNISGNVDHQAQPTFASGTYFGAAYTEDATVLDQVVLARDASLTYAWISRNGVLTVGDGGYPGITYTEADYLSDIDLGFDPATIVNEVLVVSRFRPSGNTTDNTEYRWGPYVDQLSRREWGAKAYTHTVQGFNNASQARLVANRILAANATARPRCTNLRLPIRSTADVIPGRGLVEHFDRLRVVNTDKAIDQTDAVQTITHTIRPNLPRQRGHAWVVELAFTGDGQIARQRSVPTPRSLTPTA